MAHRAGATATSNFGVGRREAHDARAFYGRFSPPVISTDDAVSVADPERVNRIYAHDARDMSELADSSVALVVTSPPYFAGKEYEESLGRHGVPATYLEYLDLLHEVFAGCVTKLEPGGRIAVNVANLGRKPYRSLSADVIAILQDRLQLLLRGEIIWVKGKGAGSSCAWGSFQSPANPVLRDVTERVIVASKGRFDRAVARKTRAERGLPSEVSIFKDDFMEATIDLWDLPSESATRVGHPAPFPVELPQRLIELHTYRGDLVLDPFMGSGTTAVAAVRTGRLYAGYETDPGYVRIARERVECERERIEDRGRHEHRAIVATSEASQAEDQDTTTRAVRAGATASEIARALLQDCGFRIDARTPRLPGGVEITLSARDTSDRTWLFEVCGAFAGAPTGLRRMETLWKSLGKAGLLTASEQDRPPLVLLTTELPATGSPAEAALSAGRGKLFVDALELLAPSTKDRLRAYAAGS